MRKSILTLFVLSLVCMYGFGQEIVLDPLPDHGGNGQGQPKSPTEQVLAMLEGNLLYLSFAPSSSSEVTITNSQTNSVVYSNTFGVAAGQIIPLSTLPSGEYELVIYAFGKWWRGEFVIEEDD